MEVGDARIMSMSAGCVAELNIGILLSSLHNICFMAERVSKNNVAAFINKFFSSCKATVVFTYVSLDKDLIIR